MGVPLGLGLGTGRASAGVAGGISAAVDLRQAGIAATDRKGIEIGLLVADSNAEWTLRGVERQLARRASAVVGTGGNTVTITLPPALVDEAGGNAWTIGLIASGTAQVAANVGADVANRIRVYVSNTGITLNQIRDLIVASSVLTNADIVVAGNGGTILPRPAAEQITNFAGGRAEQTLEATVDEDAKRYTLRYAPTADDVTAVAALINGGEDARATIIGTTLANATLESPAGLVRPFEGRRGAAGSAEGGSAFTDALRRKLDGIAEGATAVSIADVLTQILAGAGITVDRTTPGQITIAATGAGGGMADGVVQSGTFDQTTERITLRTSQGGNVIIDLSNLVTGAELTAALAALPGTDLGIANRDADGLDLTSSTGDDVPMPAATETQAGLATGQLVKDVAGRHDAGGSDAPHTAEDNKRLTRLEQLTSDIKLRTHEGWGEVTDARSGAVTIRALDSFSADPATVAAYNYLPSFPTAADGTYVVILRIPSGNAVNSYQVRRTGSVLQELHGVFHGGSVSGGGYDYYFMAGSIELATGDTLTVQSIQNVFDHTEYDGEVEKLDEHAAQTYAHKDSPVRVDHLGIAAPAGRRAYLTAEIHHPGSQHLFSADLGLLAPNNLRGNPQFAGVSVADFSGDGGAAATADTSAFPGVLNAARIAGIFERQGDAFFTVAVNKAINAAAPTHINISYRADLVDPQHESRYALAQHGADVVIGGQTYRLMRTAGTPGLYNFLQSRLGHGESPTLYFAVEYPAGYLKVDGTLDRGTTQPVGEYESLGAGRWRSRGESIIARLVAELGEATTDDRIALWRAFDVPAEVLYRDAVARQYTKNRWTVITLAREITADDSGRYLMFRLWNAEADSEVFLPVRNFLGIVPQAAGGSGDNINQRPVVLAISSGDTDGVGVNSLIEPFYVGRPSGVANAERSLMVGSPAFGNDANHSWRSFQMSIELRSLV